MSNEEIEELLKYLAEQNNPPNWMAQGLVLPDLSSPDQIRKALKHFRDRTVAVSPSN